MNTTSNTGFNTAIELTSNPSTANFTKGMYFTCAGMYSIIYGEMLEAGHMLIAGAQGCGKSTVLDALICVAAMSKTPARAKFILIDPKRVDLLQYKDLPHVMRYETEIEGIVDALNGAISIMERRYTRMAQNGQKVSDEARIYIIIDELADLMTTNKKRINPLLQRLTQLGRAAQITVIAATQCCLRSVISTEIKCNFPARLGLRTACRQDSRNIIDMAGCEMLPNPRTEHRAQGYWRNGCETRRYTLHAVKDEERAKLLEWYSIQRQINEAPAPRPARRGFFARLFGAA